MIRTVLCFLLLGITALVILPICLVLKLFSLIKPEADMRPAARAAAAFVVREVLLTTGIRVHRRGEENLPGGPALFVGNHQGAFDAIIPVAFLGQMKCIVMKKQIASVPIAKWWIEFADCIFLDRGSIKAAVSCIIQIRDKLKSGSSVALFPEGTRSRGPQMGAFKAGAFRSAVEAGVPIVPFVIDGSWKRYEEKGRITPGAIELSILPPIETSELSTDAESIRALTSDIKQLMEKELENIRTEK